MRKKARTHSHLQIPNGANARLMRTSPIRVFGRLSNNPLSEYVPSGGEVPTVVIDKDAGFYYWDGEEREATDLGVVSSKSHYIDTDFGFTDTAWVLVEWSHDTDAVDTTGTLLTWTSGYSAGNRVEVPFGADAYGNYAELYCSPGNPTVDYAPMKGYSFDGEAGEYQQFTQRQRVLMRIHSSEMHKFLPENGEIRTALVGVGALSAPTRLGIGCRAWASGTPDLPIKGGTVHKVIIWTDDLPEASYQNVGLKSDILPVHLLGDSFLTGYDVYNRLGEVVDAYGKFMPRSQDGIGGSSLTHQAARFAAYTGDRQKWWNSTLVICDFGFDGTSADAITAINSMVATIPHNRWIYMQAAVNYNLTAGEIAQGGTDNDIAVKNAFPANYVSTLEEAWAESDGSPEDEAMVAVGKWPLSLRIDTGNFHPSDLGNQFISRRIYDALAERGLVRGSRPALETIAARLQSGLVDFVAIGDLNQKFGNHGWDHGMQYALSQNHQMYATGLISLHDNNGSGGGIGYKYNSSSVKEPLLTATTAPSAFDDYWPTAADSLHGYGYIADGESYPWNENTGIFLDADCPLDTAEALQFDWCYGTFGSGAGSFGISVRHSVSPYTKVVQGSVPTNTGSDGMAVHSELLSADAGRAGIRLGVKWTDMASIGITGPFLGLWLRVSRTDVTSGFSYHTLSALDWKTTRDHAAFIQGMSDTALSYYFEQVRRLQGGTKTVVVTINGGVIDTGETQPSLGPGGYTDGDSAEAFVDNHVAIVNRIKAIWSLNGWSQRELFWLFMPSHAKSEPADAELSSYRSALSAYAETLSQAQFVDMSLLIGHDDMVSGGYYNGGDFNRLSQSGYETIGGMIVNEIE